MQAKLASEAERFAAEMSSLRSENEELAARAQALQDEETVVVINSANADTFFASQARPLKAVLFTTKPDIPPLWQQLYDAQSMTTAFGLYDAQSMTTAFGVVRHVEERIMEKFSITPGDLPRIYLSQIGRGKDKSDVVRHVEERIMEKFSITPGDLPRICLFADGKNGRWIRF
ncbi:hypothetical protein T484DRAFT_1762416 [Baffinella frigidus]|nr:hypothetical protein T484DRAFT_1762416 [Cryptophyta sp. CCMP2293]